MTYSLLTLLLSLLFLTTIFCKKDEACSISNTNFYQLVKL